MADSYYWGPEFNRKRREKYKDNDLFRLKEQKRAREHMRKLREKRNGRSAATDSSSETPKGTKSS